jgi:hypothetical protein
MPTPKAVVELPLLVDPGGLGAGEGGGDGGIKSGNANDALRGLSGMIIRPDAFQPQAAKYENDSEPDVEVTLASGASTKAVTPESRAAVVLAPDCQAGPLRAADRRAP